MGCQMVQIYDFYFMRFFLKYMKRACLILGSYELHEVDTVPCN